MNLITIKNLLNDRNHIDNIFRLSNELYANSKARKKINKIMATLFIQPSTRTRLSFESAMVRLGGQVLSVENGSENSSIYKGESLNDTLKTVDNYADVIVLRSTEPLTDDISLCCKNSYLINAGDGNNEHPTQNLIDLYTILQKFINPKNRKIGFFGDLLNSRTVHGLAFLLENLYDIKVYYFVKDNVQQINNRLLTKDHSVIVESNVGEYIKDLDIFYLTRSHSNNPSFRLKSDYLNAMKKDAIIMHPLPRGVELPSEIDKDSRSVYFDTVNYGLYVRMGLLTYIFD